MTSNSPEAPVIIVIFTLGFLLVVYIAVLIKFIYTIRKRKKREVEKSFHSPVAFIRKPKFFIPNLLGSPKCELVQPRTFEELDKSEEKLAQSKSTDSISTLGVNDKKQAGQLKFSLQYDSLRSILSVHLHKAKNLPQPEPGNGDVVYYIIIKILPLIHRSFQSKTMKNSRNPEFDETFQFYIPYEVLTQQIIKITVNCFDKFSHHEPLGELVVHLNDLEERGINIARAILLYRNFNAVRKPAGYLGELMMSLGYLRLTERLTVVVVAAKNLVSENEIVDSYVEVCIIHTGRKLKRKRTSTRRGDCNPVFNETLTFHIPRQILHQISLLVCVKLDEMGQGDDKLLGQVLLGSESTGIQFEHWNEMRFNNKPIARWHKLYE